MEFGTSAGIISMCGRFYNHLQSMHNWADILKDWPSDSELSYNVSPTSVVPIVTKDGAIAARWSLIPAWSKVFESKYPTHNARSESVSEKPTFRSAWKHRRTCLVPVGGYYEWKKENNIKQPYVIHHASGVLMLAGLWETWESQISFTILTEDALGELANVHHRMPVFIDKQTADDWLSGEGSLAVPEPKFYEQMSSYKVNTRVNNSRAEGPDLIQKI